MVCARDVDSCIYCLLQRVHILRQVICDVYSTFITEYMLNGLARTYFGPRCAAGGSPSCIGLYLQRPDGLRTTTLYW